MELEAKAGQIRKDIIEMIWRAGSGHFGGSLSIVEILSALYFRVMRIDPRRPLWDDRDRFILSKGHAAAALYATLAEKGYFPVERLFDSFMRVNGILQEHPDMKKVAGLDMSSGSLGQGLSAAAGMAWGLKTKGQNCRVFCLVGDGEVQEGQIWEAAMASSHLKLDNLTTIVDYNGLQVNGPIKDVMNLEPLVDKWNAFGWSVSEVDGHNIAQIIETIEDASAPKPKAIIAHTIKGKGVSFMENRYEFHSAHLNREQYETALKEVSER